MLERLQKTPAVATMMRMTYALATALAACSAQAQVTTYDAATGVVTIPSVAVGPAAFTAVTLKDRGHLRFELTGAREQKPAMPADAVARYDSATGVLSVPAVKFGETTFVDVTLVNTGNFVFQVQQAKALPASVMAEIDSFFRAVEAQTATAVPATGEARLALVDRCWANSGRTRANFIADWDANSAEHVQRDSFLVGRRVENILVRALRNSTNPDGSARREIDVQYDTVYRDGTADRGRLGRLVSGSSAGTPRCTTPQVGSQLRELGDQRLVQVVVRGQSMREQRYAIADGAPLNPAVRFRREVDFFISDPMGNVSHAVVTGPGPTNTTAGVTYPFSFKLLSPRLLRSAPELQGKTGNFLNALDDDSFRNCVLPNGAVPVAELVDCAANPGNNSGWGIGFTSTPDAADDSAFLAQGWREGGVYRFDLYNDDGWKTVGGHVGRAPVATYYATLEALPYSFVEIVPRFPTFTLGGLTPAQMAANAGRATPAPLALAWTAPGPLSGARMHLNQVWEFHQGPRIGNPDTAFYPAYRSLSRAYPGSTATATAAFPAAPRHPQQASKTYVEYTLFYRDPTTGNNLRSRINFQ